MSSNIRKVLWVSHAANYGGAELFLRDLLSRKFNGRYISGVAFFQQGPIVTDIQQQGHAVYVLKGGLRALQLKRSSSAREVFRSLVDIVLLILTLKKIMKDYDVVVANSQKSLFIAGFAAILIRKPFLWILHDLVDDANFSRVMRSAIAFAARYLCRAVIVNSRAARDALIKSCGQLDNVSVIYNGFEFEDLASRTNDDDRRALLESFGLTDAPTVGLFGRITFWKGQHILLDALNKIPSVQALIVGDAIYDSNDYLERLTKTVNEFGLSDRVRFVGHRKDVARLIRAVDVVIHSSISPEPFGRVIVEGMAQKRPVIATRGGGVPEIIDDEVDGLLVAPGDAEALAQAIDALLNKPDFSKSLAEAGYRKVRAKFAIETTVSDFIKILDAQ